MWKRPERAPSGMDIAPRFLFIQVNKRCNLRCTHCAFWLENDDDRHHYLDLAGKERVLREFSQLNPKGAVVICGGESMLDLEEYFGICRICRERALTCISVVNGTRIRSDEMAERMIREGPHEISISLNSHRADLHDETRGVPGAFEKAVAALRLLVAARRRLGAPTRIYVMGLIFDENYRELEEFYDFVLNDVGADKLKLNFIQPSFGDMAVDHFFEQHAKIDANELMRRLRGCETRFGLKYNPAWLGAVRMYFESLADATQMQLGWAGPARTRDHICNTEERNIMVDHYGVARLCFSTDFRGAPLRQEGDLTAFWRGANDVRAEMRGCNRLCGISHSVRRHSATTTPAAYSLTAANPASQMGWLRALRNLRLLQDG